MLKALASVQAEALSWAHSACAYNRLMRAQALKYANACQSKTAAVLPVSGTKATAASGLHFKTD